MRLYWHSTVTVAAVVGSARADCGHTHRQGAALARADSWHLACRLAIYAHTIMVWNSVRISDFDERNRVVLGLHTCSAVHLQIPHQHPQQCQPLVLALFLLTPPPRPPPPALSPSSFSLFLSVSLISSTCPARYKGVFREQAIDGAVLLMLTPDDLRSHFQVRTIRETTQILEKVRTSNGPRTPLPRRTQSTPRTCTVPTIAKHRIGGMALRNLDNAVGRLTCPPTVSHSVITSVLMLLLLFRL